MNNFNLYYYIVKQKIQRITGVIALSAGLIGHAPAFVKEGDAFVDVNEEFPWHIGVQANFRSVEVVGRISKGLTSLIGPFVEWKPLNGIGIRSGLMYSYTSFLTMITSGRHSSLPSVGVDVVKFHALNIPLHFRFYPGKDRQFLIQLVYRLEIPFAGKQFNLVKRQNKQVVDHLNIDNYFSFGLGIGYKMKSGFMVGIGESIELGYDFSKLVIKA